MALYIVEKLRNPAIKCVSKPNTNLTILKCFCFFVFFFFCHYPHIYQRTFLSMTVSLPEIICRASAPVFGLNGILRIASLPFFLWLFLIVCDDSSNLYQVDLHDTLQIIQDLGLLLRSSDVVQLNHNMTYMLPYM